MLDIIPMKFSFEENAYSALVRIKNDLNIEYYITVMDGELEKLLYGNHIFIKSNGHFEKHQTDCKVSEDVLRLRAAIVDALHVEFN